MGLDMEATDGLMVRAPVTGVIVREAHPYGDGSSCDHGCWISGRGDWQGYEIGLFYMRIADGLLRSMVQAGDIIGIALSLQDRYPGITNHVHLAVRRAGQYLDPAPYLFHDQTPPDHSQA